MLVFLLNGYCKKQFLFLKKNLVQMKHIKNKTYLFIIVALLTISPILTMAQAVPGSPCDDPEFQPCPIDTGVVLLVVAVIAIAAKKAYEYKKHATVYPIL